MLYQPVFIISEPRSGSTWLQHALSSHPDIFCTELRLFGDLFDTVIDVKGDGSTVRRNRSSLESYVKCIKGHVNIQYMGVKGGRFTDDIEYLFARQLFEYMAFNTGKRVIVDKFTSSPEPYIIEKCKFHFPDAKYIYLGRDGRDIAVSKFFDWLTKRKFGDEDRIDLPFRKFVKNEDVEIRRLFTDDSLTKYAEAWVQHMESNADKCGMKIFYESMLRDQFKVLNEMFRYLGAKCDEQTITSCIDSSRVENMISRSGLSYGGETTKIRSATSGGWKKYFTHRDAEIFVKIAGEKLIEFCYESDDSWIEECPLELSLVG